MKKVYSSKVLLVALVLVFLVPVSAFAETGTEPEPLTDIDTYGAGVWDTILNQNMTVATSPGTSTSTVTSGGGDVRICVKGINAGNQMKFQFYIPGYGPINPVIYLESDPSELCPPKIDVRPYVNSNGKVSLYVKATSLIHSSDNIDIKIQD